MARKRKLETEEQRAERLKKKAELQHADDQEEDAMDAMVRKSIKLHGP